MLSGIRSRLPVAAAIGGLALLAHALWLSPLPLAWRGVGALLLLALPGALLALLLFEHERDPLLLGFLALCGAITLQVPLLLGLHALPGPLTWPLVLASCDAVFVLVGWQLLRRQPGPAAPPASQPHWAVVALAGILLLGAALRLLFLGSAELQGDEARALLMGLDAVNGTPDILLLHSKGPVEALLPVGLLALLGNTNEWVARLPFALAGIGVPLGAYLLAREMFGGEARDRRIGELAGLAAAAILALDGFLIAFARIVQYQNILVLLTLGALWCCWRFYSGAVRPQLYLISAAALVAVGLLAHYDGVFALPALAWLVIAGGRRRGWRAVGWARGLAAPVLVGSVLLLSFYVPFVLHPYFGHTLQYLEVRTGKSTGSDRFVNNLVEYYRRATFYNTTYQINALGAALGLGLLAWIARHVRPRALGWALAGLLLLGAGLLALDPARFALPGGNWAIVALGLPLLALALARNTPPPLRALALWFAAAFIAEAFLIANPMTHFYTIDAAAALLVGRALAELVAWLRERGLPWLLAPLGLLGAALALLAAPYLYIVFVRQSPEYRLVFPAARPAIYQAIYGDQLPTKGGYFGFPHQAGWKVIGELYRQGILQGDFESNEDFLITHWYTRKAPRCDKSPDYYILARRPVDAGKVPQDTIAREYHVFGTVLVGGAEALDIYQRGAVAAPARTFELRDFAGAFERRTLVSALAQSTRLDLAPLSYADARWQSGVSLQSTNVAPRQIIPNQDHVIVLQWAASAPLDRPYRAFVEVVDRAGAVVGSAGPFCSANPPAKWNTRPANSTSVIWSVPTELAPGAYTLQAGLRDAVTGAVLPRADGTRTLAVGMLTVTAR